MAILLVEPFAATLRSPTTTFVLLLAIALIIPPLFERIKLPGLVGLLVAGVVFGGSALGWLDPASETMKLLSEIGKIYLMFVAGLEIDLALFQRTRNRSLSFGFLTFIIPFIFGVAVGLFFNFGWLAAVLIGSLLASHTLLAYPIVQRLGVVSDEAVTVTVGATIFTDVTALVVLAICLGISKGDFTTAKLIVLLGSLGLYAIAVLFGLKRLAEAFFRATGKDEGNQFLFVMLSVFLAAVVAQLIGVESIIGAFLAGLAINSVIGDGPVKEKTEFLGGVLFIPMFFVNMGLLLDLDALGDLLQSVALPIMIVGALIVSKLLAALGTKLMFGYSWPQTWTMWSLSLPQVAATLAAALVGYQADIINVQVFNSVILLMLVTAIMGPLITARTARRIALTKTSENMTPLSWLPVPAAAPEQAKVFTVVVPIYNPKTEFRLLELAATIAHYEQGQVVPLAVALAQPQMDSPQLQRAIAHARHRLAAAEAISQNFAVPLSPTLRVEYSIPQAICHLSREKDANLIVLGMGYQPKLGAINSVHDDVLWSAHCPVVVARLLASPADFKHILLPIENPSPLTIRVLRFAQVLAAANQGKMTLLHVCSSFSSKPHRLRIEKQLHTLIDELPPAACDIAVQIVVQDNWVGAIEGRSRDYDLVILRSQRRNVGNALGLSATTQPLVERISGSVILVGEPYAQQNNTPTA
ncbi:MAG: cation:proton antiporter [Phormidesmis sp.]